MVPEIREQFNAAFSKANYEQFVEHIKNAYPNSLAFRVAETPIFIDKSFKSKVLEACESIVDVIVSPDFKQLTENAIPVKERVPNENNHTDFIAFDFGICINDKGEYEPQLIEMQGFPTLFGYQVAEDEITRQFFNIPENYSPFLNGFNKDSYVRLLKDIIIGDHAPEEAILLEIYPFKQKTAVDFIATKELLGISIVCLTELIAEGKCLYYMHNGKKQRVKRIYNRIIFDELDQIELPAGTIDIRDEYSVEWAPHPNWFYRISKYTLPFINSPYVPKTQFLNKLESIPEDLENYVLKPLFSFAGQGVNIDITKEDILNTPNPENWILQRKVTYAEVIKTPDIPSKAEIRIFYFWPPKAERPVATMNLARLSKGKMIGVRYNNDKEWVGGTIVYFEE
ncbi:hypothetical protein [Polluticaenibacter yanchengensis]|uniref:Circularly permuted type 2 ATP-grasp protein n=1 Tax=Polluticaenibacter yanchengensis TaxID=3014562 RepID=A0ABT4UHA9_9BACT|nr:hypothetical protein [Chitinophagaceae bacterium LY-5]